MRLAPKSTASRMPTTVHIYRHSNRLSPSVSPAVVVQQETGRSILILGIEEDSCVVEESGLLAC